VDPLVAQGASGMTPAFFAALLGACAVFALASALRGPTMSPAAIATGRSGGGALERLGGIGSSRARARVETRLREADVTWSAAAVVGAQRAALVVAVLAALMTPGLGTALAIAMVVGAFRGPSFVLGRVTRTRVADAAREMPLFLDLLAVATSAGLGPQVAVRRAVEPVEGPLADELERALRDADLGRRWRDELAAAGERLRLADLERAIRLLVRTERLGSSLADEMARLASDVREERRSRAIERARAAPVKMLFPLVFLILPAFLLLTVVPVLLTTVTQIG
jgi:tight adherence protein C